MARKAKSTAPRRSTGRARRAAKGSSFDGLLCQEVFNVAIDTCVQLGMDPALVRRYGARALKGKERLRPSVSVLKNENGIGVLMGQWRGNPQYREEDGNPKVIPIRGRGVTLERLVKKCVPQMSIEDVVEILCQHCDAQVMKGERLALLGSPVKIMEKTPAVMLAFFISQVRHMAETTVHNARIPASAKGAGGRFQRQIFGAVALKRYFKWSVGNRELLKETANEIEKDLAGDDEALVSGREKICGVGLFEFREDGNIG